MFGAMHAYNFIQASGAMSTLPGLSPQSIRGLVCLLRIIVAVELQ